MKLSEAIRLGAMLRPQGTNSKSMLWWVDERGTCALGAALHAQGLRGEFVFDLIREAHPWIRVRGPNCPICQVKYRVYETIYHLNDKHLWTREQIAGWVESIEPKEAEIAIEQDLAHSAQVR